MSCAQCQGIEELFSEAYVNKELQRYRARGPIKTTGMLIEAIRQTAVEGLTLLDIGGGVGALQHALLQAGAQEATSVDASQAYTDAAREEAQRRGLSSRVKQVHANFTDAADRIAPADIVTLDRVICCYDDMEKLVRLSAERARRLYGLVYPRDTWWLRFGLRLENAYFKLSRCPYRSFIHSSQAVEGLLKEKGFRRISYRRTLFWQVAVFAR